MLAMTAVPHFASADVGTISPDAPAPVNSALVAALTSEDTLGFCGALSAFKDKTLAQVATVTAAIESDKSKNQLLVQQRESDKDAAITTARTGESQTMASVFGNLEARATTATQKAAVKEFEKAVSDTTAIRQGKVDAAVSTYRAGLKSSLDLQDSQISAAVAAFQASLQKSLTDANSDCASGIASATLRVSLKSNLKAAKAALVADENKIDDASAKITDLLAARRKAIVSADQDFHGALNAARNSLKVAFPN